MKWLFVILSLVAVLAYSQFVVAAQITNPCKVGEIRGFAHVRGDPRIGIGSLPSTLTNQQDQFFVRYNCKHLTVYARRIDEGEYEVWFPENPARTAQVTAVNSQGASASAYFNGNGHFIVVIRGPAVNNSVLEPRELSFYIVVI